MRSSDEKVASDIKYMKIIHLLNPRPFFFVPFLPYRNHRKKMLRSPPAIATATTEKT